MTRRQQQATSNKRQQEAGFRDSAVACRLSPVAAFSLVELVISMAILAVGIVGAMRVFPVGLRASRRSELSSRATILAQRTLECLKLKPWDELVEGDTLQLCREPSEGASGADEARFTITPRMTQPTIEHLTDAGRLKAVEVTIQWTQDGRSRESTFVTYLRRDTS